MCSAGLGNIAQTAKPDVPATFRQSSSTTNSRSAVIGSGSAVNCKVEGYFLVGRFRRTETISWSE